MFLKFVTVFTIYRLGNFANMYPSEKSLFILLTKWFVICMQTPEYRHDNEDSGRIKT